MLFYCNCCSFYFISNKGWGKEKRVKYKFLSSQSVWCLVITTRRCWPNWKSKWWSKIRNRLVRVQKKHRNRSRWNTPHPAQSWRNLDSGDFSHTLVLFVFQSHVAKYEHALMKINQLEGKNEERRTKGEAQSKEIHTWVTSVAIVKPNPSWRTSVGKLIVCVHYRLKSRLRQEEEELFKLRHRYQLLEVNLTFPLWLFKSFWTKFLVHWEK